MQKKPMGHVNPIGIRSCYDEGKRCSETILLDYHKFQKLDVTIARVFNTYGAQMMTKMVGLYRIL